MVATLWKIPDQETALLMQSFWQNLADENDKATSLALAQRAPIAKRRTQRKARRRPIPVSWSQRRRWSLLPRSPTSAKPPAKVASGERLTVNDRRGEWLRVRVPGSDLFGWVLGKHAESVESVE